MDYLDPKKKREHKIRLTIGYSLFAIAIAFATLLLVYLANGYYVDRNTGEFIQNGLLYMNTQPGGADVYLNDQKQRGQTDLRAVVPAGTYKVEMKKAGYRDWKRTLLLEGGSLRRLSYARLIPQNLTSAIASDLRSNPANVSQSIDKKWLVLSYSDNPLLLQSVNIEDSVITPVALQIPENIVSAPNGQIKILEWADDNRTFIATYTVRTTIEYLLVDRENPALSQNLTTLFGDPELLVEFQDRKRDKFFVYKPSTQSLFTASLSTGVSVSPYVTNVQHFKTFGRDWVIYITSSDTEGLVNVRFKRGDKDILLKQVKTSDKYFLQLAKLGNAPVMGVASTVEDKASIYNDPEKYLNENPGLQMPIATTVLRVEDPIDLRISADSSIILAYGPKNYASHEFDADRSYTFKVSVPMDPQKEIHWVDGQHFIFSSNGMQIMMDFDGSNMHELVASAPTLGSYYTEDLNLMYSFVPAAAKSGTTPASPARINLTNLLIEADR